jgi:hypothetical protein
MNKSQFTAFMKAPAALPPESTQLLVDVLKEFPYCQTAQLLYAKSLHLQNSIHYNNQLKIAAAYATDRSLLYKLIVQTPVTQKAVSDVQLKVVSRSDEQIVTELKLPVPTPKAESPAEPLVTPAAQTDTRSPRQILEARLLELDELKRKAESELLEKTKPEEQKPAPVEAEPLAVKEEPAQANVMNHAGPPVRKMAAVPEPENITEPINTDDTLQTVVDLETLSGTYISTAIDASIQIEIEQVPAPLSESAQAEEQLETEAENLRESQAEPSELSFSAWLKKSGKHEAPPAQDPLLEKQNEEKKHKETELIEKFIKEEPRISKPKKEFYSPVSMARQSVIEDLDFVTETLAGIYAKQGNTSKAIRAYQTLSLRYPEKKLYFASLIEKLETGA